MIDLKIGRVIHGDCLDVMRQMPDESIKLVVTSPPYNINGGHEAPPLNLAAGSGPRPGSEKDTTVATTACRMPNTWHGSAIA